MRNSKLWRAVCIVVLAVSLAMVVYYSVSAKAFTGPITTQPLICKAASVYTDGTVIERPCSVETPIVDPFPGDCDVVYGCKMIMPEPGKHYRPGR